MCLYTHQLRKIRLDLHAKQKKDIWQCADIVAQDADCRIGSRQERWRAGLAYWKDCRLDSIKQKSDGYTDGQSDRIDVEIEHQEERYTKPETSLEPDVMGSTLKGMGTR